MAKKQVILTTKKQASSQVEKLELPTDKLLYVGEGQWIISRPILISPKKSKFFLDNCNTENRRPKNRNINKMSSDMNIGSYLVTHQSIAFRVDLNKNGYPILADGQNRLMAIIRSGKSVKLRFHFGLSKEAMIAVDCGVVRTAMDAVKLNGMKLGDENVTQKYISSLRFFLGGRNGALQLSHQSMMTELKKWQDELDFVFSNLPNIRGQGITAAVRGAIMRAYYAHKQDAKVVKKIKEFCESISTGMNIPNKVIAEYHKRLLRQDYGGVGRKAIYADTTDVINHYLNGGKRLVKSKQERWLLPDEQETDNYGDKI